ncbi:MAG: hypothetical protein ACTSR0_07550, partial [Candidatus Asgardarchaeia archaeon]
MEENLVKDLKCSEVRQSDLLPRLRGFHRKLERLGSVHDKALPFGLGHDSPCHEHIAHGSFQHVF